MLDLQTIIGYDTVSMQVCTKLKASKSHYLSIPRVVTKKQLFTFSTGTEQVPIDSL